jgi:hypothetical protein
MVRQVRQVRPGKSWRSHGRAGRGTARQAKQRKGTAVKIEDIVGNKRLSKRDAQEANAELAKIRQRYGKVTKELVVKWARPSRNPLHKHFEWNRDKAAHQHRLNQAGALIRSIRVVIRIDEHKEPETVRAQVSLMNTHGASYVPMVEALSVEETRRQLLVEALRELDQLRKRYSILQELAVVFAAIEKVAARKGRKRAA